MADDVVTAAELKSLFDQAAKYVRHNSGSLSSEQLLYFYARFKQVNEGTCNTKKPGIFDFQGKQKWDAWKKLGDKSREAAMREYISHLSSLCPEWEDNEQGEEQQSKGDGSWVSVSTMSNTDTEIADENKTVFDWCKEGNVQQMKKLLTSENIDVNAQDDGGMTLLHWASDRGFTDTVAALISLNADVNIQDEDQQTALHYAVSCEHKDIVDKLLSHHADASLKDSDGLSPLEMETSSEIKQLLVTHTS